MALLVLIVLGATFGWLASILARRESVSAILQQVGIGIGAALVGGLTMNSGSLLGSLSLAGLGVSAACAIAALVIYHAILSRREDAGA